MTLEATILYSGNHLKTKGEQPGVSSHKYLEICLDTQRLPEAIHLMQSINLIDKK
ncbi:hypothetical protein NCCP28_13070 [Niallia sp. NCCP-28]|nr:hypothetical protein NCCP28_13070 [Niallia sp. NCCP-28]